MSKLSSLFGGLSSEQETSDIGALKYAAPKEPKAKFNVAAPLTQETTPSRPESSATKPVSKIIISASVRLFRLNTRTNEFEVHESGQPLGFAVLGASNQYQILIYNSQKVPQCIVPISAQFQSSYRDLYLSMTDAQGTSWSILFDSPDILANTSFREILPMPSPPEDDQYVCSGMSVGIYFSLWEINKDTSASDLLNSAPKVAVQPPDEIVKIKLGTSEELFSGFNELLLGSRKGSKLIIIASPKLQYSPNLLNGYIPSNWVVVMVDVLKIKSEKEKKKKKGVQDDSDSHGQDLTSRMAFLASQSSGGVAGQLAVAMGKPALHFNQTKRDSQDSDIVRADDRLTQSSQVPFAQEFTMQQSNVSSSVQIAQPFASQAFLSTNDQNAIALVPGQDSRSFYQGSGRNEPRSSTIRYDSINGAQSQQFPTSASVNLLASSCGDIKSSGTSGEVITSLQSLHHKVDQISMSMGSVDGVLYHTRQKPFHKPEPVKQKAEDIIASLRSLMEDYDRMVAENASATSKDTILKLQNKVETLQDKNERLMNEKSALLEKQSDLLQQGADSSSRYFSLQQELETLRRENQLNQTTITALQEQLNFSRLNSASSDKLKTERLQIELSDLHLELETVKSKYAASEKFLQKQVESLTLELESESARLLSSSSDLVTLKKELDIAHEKIKILEDEQANTYFKLSSHSELSAQNETLKKEAENLANNTRITEARINDLVESLSIKEAEIIDIKQRLENELGKQTSNVGNDINEENVKEFMQDIYSKAVSAFSNEADVAYSTQEIIKILRSVLKNVTNERLNYR